MAEVWKVDRTVLAGTTQRWEAYLLGHDDYGTWLYTPEATPIRDEQGQQVDSLQAQAQLYPAGKRWVASWFEDGSLVASVTSLLEAQEHSIRYSDLGMHHRVSGADGDSQDETQEYDQARAIGWEPGESDSTLLIAFTDLQRQIGDHHEPFGQIGPKWFVRITRNDLHFVAYRIEWPATFATARDEILPYLPSGGWIEHFGSTSVPGLAAKDCIDIAVAVPRSNQVQEVIPALESLGYEARPAAFNDPDHIFFRRLTDGRRSHHLHLYQEGHPNLRGVLAFRDLLRSDPQARERYQSVKQCLAEANPFDRTGYAAGKDEVAQELLQQALAKKAPEAPAHATTS